MIVIPESVTTRKPRNVVEDPKVIDPMETGKRRFLCH